MSFPVHVIHPRPYTRHVLEMWEYKWYSGRQTYESVCFRPIQIPEVEGNRSGNIDGFELFSPQNIRVEDMDSEVQRLLNPASHREKSQSRLHRPDRRHQTFGLEP